MNQPASLHRLFTLLTYSTAMIVQSAGSSANEPVDDLLAKARANFASITAVAPEELEKPLVVLGQHLFWDKRLSANGKIACASCHGAGDWGADAAPFSIDANGKPTKRNSQTVLNAMLQPNLRWTADRTSGAHQAEKSLTGSMGFTNADDVIELLAKYGYDSKFQVAFPNTENPTTPGNYAKAIEAYEATLHTPAAFDRYLSGQSEALTEEQKSGLQLFMSIGCANCHSGKLLGGFGLEKFGIHQDYWTAIGSKQPDAGLFESSNKEEDKYQFRVSMLRNIEKTAPHFHDGSVASLHEAIRVMAKVQLDRELDDNQTQSIVAFLSSLTGDVPRNYTDPHGQMELSMETIATPVKLFQYGSMHETIGMQQHQGRVKLGELVALPHFYGVGALERLEGEITIIDSHPYVSSVSESGTPKSVYKQSSDLQATLLVGSVVLEWTSSDVPASLSGKALENWIQSQAERVGIDTSQPFPFMIEGGLSDLRFHIINGACPVHAKRHNKPLPTERTPFEQVLESVDGQVLGIFARDAAGKLTHPGTSVHAHLVYEPQPGETVTGHLEHFGVQAGAKLKLSMK